MAAEAGRPLYTWPSGKILDLIICVGHPDNQIVLGKEKDEVRLPLSRVVCFQIVRYSPLIEQQNTSGDTKGKVQQRIASELFPDEFEDPTLSAGEKKRRQKALGTRVKGKWEQYVISYLKRPSPDSTPVW